MVEQLTDQAESKELGSTMTVEQVERWLRFRTAWRVCNPNATNPLFHPEIEKSED